VFLHFKRISEFGTKNAVLQSSCVSYEIAKIGDTELAKMERRNAQGASDR
jgi:hypothetical protein